MTMKPLLLAIAFVLLPVTAASAQDIPGAREAATARVAALPAVDSVAAAALKAVTPTSGARPMAQRRDEGGRRWVSTAKWSLLVAAAGFGAYALANSRTEHADSRAQLGILGGQVSLLGSVGLFIYDLRSDHETPENIPFEQTGQATPAGSRHDR